MGKKYLIDSNVLIEFLGQSFPTEVNKKLVAIMDKEFNISFINRIEVLGYASSDKNEEDFIDTSSIYYIDDEIINRTIKLRKDNKIKVPDAIVAATAMVYGLTLLTRNTSDFKNIENLKLENPWDWAK
ncbi:MAG: type II toxin-antitoxin system VapC family toxin [Chryseobacterium sp.]|nr:MAG: type II toxin-antitoxin system VapC family toxin [Chryseobacterium sp.]